MNTASETKPAALVQEGETFECLFGLYESKLGNVVTSFVPGIPGGLTMPSTWWFAVGNVKACAVNGAQVQMVEQPSNMFGLQVLDDNIDQVFASMLELHPHASKFFDKCKVMIKADPKTGLQGLYQMERELMAISSE
jgi:hypothetical protein